MTNKFKALVVSCSIAVVIFVVLGGLGVRASSSSNDGAYRQLGVYSEVLQRIRSEYVEEPNFEAVRSGALHGLLESLDANSSYLSPTEYKRFKEKKGDFKANIGATISKRYGFAAVVSVIPGGPAEKAGLSSLDIIEAVDGRSSREMSLAEINNTLVGERGSNITFSVVRPRKAEPQKIVVTRDNISIPAASDKMLESNIAYLKPIALNKGKAQELANKIKSEQSSGAKKLILDLRNVSEGDPAEGIAVANLFLDHGAITSLKGQKYPREDFNADPQKAITKLPLVVLVNRGTAGPAEIVAASILDNARGDVLGDKTFGIGSVQKLIEVPDGSAVILSIAKYYSPAGKAIQDSSVTPNILVADVDDAPVADNGDEEDTTDNNPPDKKPAVHPDEQLQRAIAVLKTKAS
jgi:carboxyl-terminal processing protease